MSKELNRVTITLSDRHSDYIEEYSAKTNMTKTSLIQLAIETWINQTDSLDTLKRMMAEVDRQRAEEEKNAVQGFCWLLGRKP